MAEDKARAGAAEAEAGSELAELRAAAAELARKLKAYGLGRLEALGDDEDDGPEALVREGRRMAQDLRSRLTAVEARVEQNIREHPGTWIGGLLGAIGFGLVLGMILRRKD